MEVSNIKQQFRDNQWLRYGAIVPLLIIVVLLIFLIRSWLAPREPEIPYKWYDEIIGYWAFEKIEGQKFKDIAGYNHAQLGDSLKKDEHDPEKGRGKLGSSLKLEGADYALVPYNNKFDLKEEVTLEAWVKPRASSANEDLWLSGWKYRKGIVLKNDDDDSFKEAQVKIVLDTEALIEENKLQSDCSDLRFTKSDKTTELNWYIERGCDSTSTEIWVKVPFVKAEAENPIYVYYGNFKASSQNNFAKTMRVPPVQSWRWPSDKEYFEEKIFGMDINPRDGIVLGGYENKRSSPGQSWKTVEIKPNGWGGGSRTYDYSSGANQINDVVAVSQESSFLAGFDTKQGDSQWRLRKKTTGRDWYYAVNPSEGSDRATALAVDNSDNIIMGGFDNSQGNAQWRVEKLNSKGKRLWAYTENFSSGLDMVYDVAIDSQDNILAAGVDKEVGNDEWRLVKLSPDGDVLFYYRRDLSEASDVITEVEVDSQDNILLGGFDLAEGDFQWRVKKLNSQGEEIWEYKSNPSGDSDQLKAMAVDEYDNVVVGGHDYKQGNARWRVEKLNSEGERLWVYTDNPSSGLDEINDLGIDSQDDIVLAGFASINPANFLVKKISERRYYNFNPKVNILEEEEFCEIPPLVIGKINSYDLRVGGNQVTGSVNDNLISSDLGSGWNHLVLTYDGSQQNLYVNSRLEASQALTGRINTNYNNLLLGFNYSGFIDEVKIYNRALTSEEVKEVYQSSQ